MSIVVLTIMIKWPIFIIMKNLPASQFRVQMANLLKESIFSDKLSLSTLVWINHSVRFHCLFHKVIFSSPHPWKYQITPWKSYTNICFYSYLETSLDKFLLGDIAIIIDVKVTEYLLCSIHGHLSIQALILVESGKQQHHFWWGRKCEELNNKNVPTWQCDRTWAVCIVQLKYPAKFILHNSFILYWVQKSGLVHNSSPGFKWDTFLGVFFGRFGPF